MYYYISNWIKDLSFLMIIFCHNIIAWELNSGYYYYFSENKTTNDNARTQCQTFTADLLSIANENEQNYIRSKIRKGYHIGLFTDTNAYNRGNRSEWLWRDGTTFNWHNWEDGRPRDNEGACGRLFNTGVWRDVGCKHENYLYICKKKDQCESNPCYHGICTNEHSMNSSYKCECETGYTGVRCENDIDECLLNPCNNGGTCLDLVGQYECVCANTKTGNNCEIEVNESEADQAQCNNGGTCRDVDDGFVCDCEQGWTGFVCETDLNECESTYCGNGTCVNEPGTFNCYCEKGYAGHFCDVDVDECDNDNVEGYCSNGFCENSVGSYNCVCKTGFAGDHCEVRLQQTEGIALIATGCTTGVLFLIIAISIVFKLFQRYRRHTNQQPDRQVIDEPCRVNETQVAVVSNATQSSATLGETEGNSSYETIHEGSIKQDGQVYETLYMDDVQTK